jgi:quinone-modifying oxidoreductase, subunit QmoA
MATESNLNKKVLVVGGGISGITTAIEIAEVGHEVVLIEKLPYLGGKVVKFHEYFPKLCPPYCGLEINFRRIKQNPRIEVLTQTELLKVEGKKGNYKASLKSLPEYINHNCTACGACANVCPVERDNEFNYNLDKTKAIYLPHELAFPFQYFIDDSVCKKEECAKCQEVCKYDAIHLDASKKTTEIEVSSIVYATGWQPYDANKIEILSYSKHQDIITNVEFERLVAPNGPTQGKLVKPSDGEKPKDVVFVQCAGSRDENHLPYCSAVCCSASLKHALIVRKRLPEARVRIFYIDLRVTGRNEDFLNKVKDDGGIELIKGKAGKIDIAEGKILITAEDIAANKRIKTNADLVVLATGIVPETMSNLETDEFGFLNNNGIISAGCAKRPMDVSASLKDATSAALKAIQNN